MSEILKNIILDKFENSEWDTTNAENHSSLSIDIITNSIIEYIRDNHILTAITNGTYSVPPTILPIVSEVLKSTLYIVDKTQSSFESIYLNTVYTRDSENGINRMFLAIQNWLQTPPYQVTLNINTLPTGIITTIIPPNVPISPIIFPTMANMGIICQKEIRATSFPKDTKKAIPLLWKIVSKYIQRGLNQNVIPPIPTSGFVSGSFPYIGITNVTLSFS